MILMGCTPLQPPRLFKRNGFCFSESGDCFFSKVMGCVKSSNLLLCHSIENLSAKVSSAWLEEL
jgi:hypothetical protein